MTLLIGFFFLITSSRSGSLNPLLDSKFPIHDLHPLKLYKFISHPKSPTIRLHPDTNYKLTIFEVSIALFWILNSYCIYLNGPHFFLLDLFWTAMFMATPHFVWLYYFLIFFLFNIIFSFRAKISSLQCWTFSCLLW